MRDWVVRIGQGFAGPRFRFRSRAPDGTTYRRGHERIGQILLVLFVDTLLDRSLLLAALLLLFLER